MKRVSSLIEKKSSDFRKNHGLSSFDPIHIKSLLLKLKVKAYFKPLSSDFSGMAIKYGEDRYMLVNTNQNLARQNFTICHELYHLFIQDDFTVETTFKVGTYNKKDDEEYRADLFSSHLLMPEDGILEMISDEEMYSEIELDTVIKLEQYFQVSRRAMLYRLKGLNLIKQHLIDKYCKDVIKSAKRRGYNSNLYLPTNNTEFIGDYGDLAHKLVDSEKISEGDYFSLMMDIGIDVLEEKQENDSDND